MLYNVITFWGNWKFSCQTMESVWLSKSTTTKWDGINVSAVSNSWEDWIRLVHCKNVSKTNRNVIMAHHMKKSLQHLPNRLGLLSLPGWKKRDNAHQNSELLLLIWLTFNSQNSFHFLHGSHSHLFCAIYRLRMSQCIVIKQLVQSTQNYKLIEWCEIQKVIVIKNLKHGASER